MVRPAEAGRYACGFLARHNSELPNGLSNQRSQTLSRNSAPLIIALIGSTGHRDLLFRVGLARQPAPAMQRPDGGQRQKQRRVRVRHPLDREAAAGHETAERLARVAAHLVAENRMVAAQDVHRRDVDQHAPAGPREPEHLRHGRLFVRLLERIQHVERRHEVEHPAGEGRRRDRGPRQPAPAQLVPDIKSDLGTVETVGRAIALEQGEVGARAAAAIEDARPDPAAEGPVDQGPDEPAEAAKPEMTLFRARRGA